MGLRLLPPEDNASVVIGKHNDRLTHQGRVKHPLAGAEEVVAVYQGKAAHLKSFFRE
jgi:hypothetical protein